VHGVNDGRQTEICRVQPLGPESSLAVAIVIEKLKRYKSSGNDQIPAELLILLARQKNFHSSGINLMLKLSVVIIDGYHFYHLPTYEFYPIFLPKF
jgi:hypothetical protein